MNGRVKPGNDVFARHAVNHAATPSFVIGRDLRTYAETSAAEKSACAKS